MTEKYSPDDLDDFAYEAGDIIASTQNTANKKKPQQAPSKKQDRPQLDLFSSSDISDYIGRFLSKSKSGSSLSSVELNDLKAPLSSLSSFKIENEASMASLITKNLRNSKKSLKKDSNILSVLVMSSSAIRCTQLIRMLGSLRSDCGVGKCFAKHFKIEDQLKFFETRRPAISVGTPNRLLKLFDVEHTYFSMENVELCLIDTYRDQKLRNIFEIPETCEDLLNFYKSNILTNLKSGKTKLIFF